MVFKVISWILITFLVVFYFWGDRLRIAQGDLMASIDYPLAAYQAYEHVLADFPQSPLKKEALKKMKDLTRGNGYLKGLLEKYEGNEKVKVNKRIEKNQKFH